MRFSVLFLFAALCACAPQPSAAPRVQGGGQGDAMVAAANPLAVEAGLEVLRAGGSAVDAAVAVQATLGLVEPQSSGLAGGAFMLVYEPGARRVIVYDGRETAPAAINERLFLDATGRPMPVRTAILSGRSTGVPGVPALLETAHRAHGRRPWPSLFAGSARLAEGGFNVSPRLAGFINSRAPQAATPDMTRYFTRADGRRLQSGDTLRSPAYAATLRRLAAEGAEGFYRGPLAEEIVARVRADGGALTLADMAAYRVERREALCRSWRLRIVCTAPPPSSGVGLLQLLLMLERTDIAEHPNTTRGWYLFAEASRRMYADRDAYVGDPAFVRVPVEGLLQPTYVAARAATISPRAAPSVEAGVPPGAPAVAVDRTREPAGTSHFVVIDRWGMAVSMTTTVESVFGSGRMAGGMVLNNQLTDFSFSPVDAQGRPAANAPAAGKRPRSSMTPVIVLDADRRFVGALGSPGGNSILAYNAKTLVGWMDWRLPIQAAVNLPNLVARGPRVSAETADFPPGVIAGLRDLGLNVPDNPSGENSGLHAVVRTERGLEGAADPRREGVARAP